MITWMKVWEDTFSFKKGAEGAKCLIHLNSQAKGPILDRTLESFLEKHRRGNFLLFINRKNLSGKKTEEE